MEIKSRFLASSVSSKEVADKLTAFLDKKGVDLAPKEFDETVEYIRSLFDDEWAALTAKSGIRNLDEAIRAWYNDTKANYPESFIRQSARKPRFGKAVKSSVGNDIRKKFHDEMIDVIWNITEKYDSYGIPEFPREDDFQEILDECKRNAMW